MGADDVDVDVGTVEHRVEGGSELAVSVADQEPDWFATLAELPQEEAGLLGTQAPVRWAVIPARCTRRLLCSITTRM